ncbi:hypothetical protein BC628DRAFT_1326385 [Trametes gibbosa]|nr:hypothetical protein BC628DRAFT_1326385 [Trametes gibbosa]
MSQTNNQVAVAGPSALKLADRSLPARNGQHPVPRFLLKLYEIINSPDNEQLIKWSEAGDSFYIYNQERLAREVLGNWFKHQNFSSFVRQLNLYGFRKISALQQGLLRTDHETESIQFAHPYFHRGQPDLLALIQRKRHPPTQTHAEDSAGLLPASQDGKLSAQGVDVNMIIEGISTIQRQQQMIAADLNALKQSNDALWKEAIEARQRHAKHEDTINRILKFLAGLFGRAIHKNDKDQAHNDDQTAPRKQMLMIGDGRSGHGEGMNKLGEGDYDGHTDPDSRGVSPFSIASERFSLVETPAASASSPVHSSPALDRVHLPQSFPLTSSAPSVPKNNSQMTSQSAFPSGPDHTSTDAMLHPEAVWRSTFQNMLQSPEQFQRIVQLAANAGQPIPNLPAGSTQSSSDSAFCNALQLPYTASGGTTTLAAPATPQQFAYPAYSPISFDQSAPSQSHAPAQSDTTQGLFPPPSVAHTAGPTTAAEDALLQNSVRMQKAYRDTAEIDADMDLLQSNIHTLVRDMGLDPHNPVFPPVPDAEGAPDSGFGDDLSLESWLEQLSHGSAAEHVESIPLAEHNEKGMDDISAFLNIPNIDSAPSGVAPAHSASGTGMTTSPTGHKRKLDAAETPQASSEADPPANKKKR